MTERPIIFNGDMVRAILSGQKTQARRPFSCHNTFFGRIGDRLWVRETFAEHPQFNEIAYRADGEEPRDGDGFIWQPRWLPPIYMPRRLSRIILEITDVRMEQLQDITEDDARAEGVDPL